MRMNKTTKHEKFVQSAEDDYYSRVIEYGESEFNRIVKPYLDRTGYYFVSGNGAWAIFDPSGKNGSEWYGGAIDHDKLPKRIYAFLSTNVSSANDIGSLLPEYDPNK